MNKFKILDPNAVEEGTAFRTYIARNLKKDEKVAIKILKKEYYSIEDCKNNKEVQVVQALNHTNVMKMLELINDSNELLMVFEYLPENVKSVMKKRDMPYSETETKVIMQQVLRGLSHIHKMGFMHRNIRPDILLCDKDATVVKISDFSMAKSDFDPLGEYTASSIWYMPPEVLLGGNTYSNAVDMWAMGCVLAELLTGKPLLPGKSDRHQMQIMFELLGRFAKREWPVGFMLLYNIGYSLPKETTGTGLVAAGVNASSEAKGLIMELLTWNPERRMTTEGALRNDFFKSDGDFVNKDESQDILNSTGDKLRTWKGRWEADFCRGSVEEFEKILAEFNKMQPFTDKSNNRHTFTGFETTNPLLGDSTQRGGGKWNQNQPMQSGGNMAKVTDDPFRPHRPTAITGTPRSLPLDQSPDRNQDRTALEEELQSRGERRSRQSSQNIQPLFAADGSISPVRRNESPRRNKQHDQLMFGGGSDTSKNEQDMKNKQQKAEKLKQYNYVKYKTIFGDTDMNLILGSNTQRREGNGPKSPGKAGGLESGQGSNPNEPAVRTRQQYSHGGEQLSYGDGQHRQINNPRFTNDHTQAARMRPSRRSSFDKFASIDHTARSEKLKQQNPVRYNDQYGSHFMSDLLGKKPLTQPPTSQPQQPQQDSLSNGYEGKDLGESEHYTPSWTENNQIAAH